MYLVRISLARISCALLLGYVLSTPLAAQEAPPTEESSLIARLKRNSQDLTAYTRLYQLYTKQGRKAEADGVFMTAVKALPASAFSANSPRALELGDFYLACGRLDMALRQYQAGMAAKPAEKLTYLNRQVDVLMLQGKRNEAAELNAEILRQNPNDKDANGVAAQLAADQGDLNAALTELQSQAVRAPQDPAPHYNLGRVYAKRAEWDAAKREFEKAIELRPNYIPARLALAQLQLSRGEFNDALETALALLGLDERNTAARVIQSTALMGLKKYGEARQVLENVLKAEPGLADVNIQLGAVNLADKKYPEAEAAFRRAYQLNPVDLRGLMGMVEAAIAQNQTDAALALLQAEAAKAPSRVDLQMALGNTAVRAAKYDLALATYQKLLNQTEKGSAAQGEVYLRTGETYRRMGNTAEAIGALNKARETLPNSVAVLNTLAMVLEAAGRNPEAGEAFSAILKLDPNNVMAMNNYAFVLAESSEDLDRALALAKRAMEMAPNQAVISDTLGWVYLKKGLLNQAIEIFRDVVEKDPARSTYHYHLARAYYLKGDQAGALAELRAAADRHPADAESKQIQALIAEVGGGK